MLEDRTTRFLARFIPIAVLTNLCLALAGYTWSWAAQISYVILGITLVVTVMGGIAYLGSVRGIQSVADSGFPNYNAWLNYSLGWRGIRATGIALVVATFAVAIFTGFGRSPWSLIAFFTSPLAGIYQAVTRRYPADETQRGD